MDLEMDSWSEWALYLGGKSMFSHYCYMMLVLIVHPTIPVELKTLGNNQFEVREAATARLESLPGWTALYFKPYLRKAKDLESRSRCLRIYNTLNKKLAHDIEIAYFLFHREQRKAATVRAWEKRMYDPKNQSKSSKEKR